MDSRQQGLHQWLTTHCQLKNYQTETMQGDASFRRYFRIRHNEQSFVAMDAPPPRENCLPFVLIANALREAGLQAPHVIAENIEAGFLLLSDLGDKVYLKALNADNANRLYQNALDALANIQSIQTIPNFVLPFFTADFMRQELQLFVEWFLKKHLQLVLSAETEKMLEDFFSFLAISAANQQQGFMHRDYHSGNLMLLVDNQVGILDFQDAFIGPVTYDLVSLLRDCYIDWPETMVSELVFYYKNKLPQLNAIANADFLRWFDLMGLQRHLKALLTFSRKCHRDNSPQYLQFIPRTLHYIATASAKYAECQAFNQYLTDVIFPAAKRISLLCAQ